MNRMLGRLWCIAYQNWPKCIIFVASRPSTVIPSHGLGWAGPVCPAHRMKAWPDHFSSVEPTPTHPPPPQSSMSPAAWTRTRRWGRAPTAQARPCAGRWRGSRRPGTSATRRCAPTRSPATSATSPTTPTAGRCRRPTPSYTDIHMHGAIHRVPIDVVHTVDRGRMHARRVVTCGITSVRTSVVAWLYL